MEVFFQDSKAVADFTQLYLIYTGVTSCTGFWRRGAISNGALINKITVVQYLSSCTMVIGPWSVRSS